MNILIRAFAAASIGLALTLLSTFVGERSAMARYPDIMSCEEACRVTATGWPLIFVRDYTGMSVVNTADIMEVWFAADQLDWLPFLANLIFWTVLAFAALSLMGRRRRLRRPSSRNGG